MFCICYDLCGVFFPHPTHENNQAAKLVGKQTIGEMKLRVMEEAIR